MYGMTHIGMYKGDQGRLEISGRTAGVDAGGDDDGEDRDRGDYGDGDGGHGSRW